MDFVNTIFPYFRSAMGFLALGWLICRAFLLTTISGAVITGKAKSIDLTYQPFWIAVALMVAYWGMPPWK